MFFNSPECSHLESVNRILEAKSYVCEECIKTGGKWIHLRTCQICGITLCCDSSPSRHARGHANLTGHAVISSAEPDENWLYCYTDNIFSDLHVKL